MMKIYITAIILALGLGVNLMAQTDGFFKYRNRFKYIENSGEYETILLPEQHGLDYNYCADNVTLESGCLLLLGMVMVYVKLKTKL